MTDGRKEKQAGRKEGMKTNNGRKEGKEGRKEGSKDI